jgi:TPR repeat protein
MKFFCNILSISAVFCVMLFIANAQKHVSAQVPAGRQSVDQKVVFAKLLRLAKQGNVAAQNNVGVAYREGKTVPKDYKLSTRWFTAAAEQGYPTAQFNLGVMYSRGLGVPRDRVVAVKWFKLAAEQGNVNAQYNLAQAYAKGAGIELDLEAAMKWYSSAAKQGDEAALKSFKLVKAYTAQILSKEADKRKTSRKAATDLSNKKQVMPVITKMEPPQTLQKTLVAKMTKVAPDRFDDALKAYQNADYAKARLLWTKLAQDGDADAQYNLANMYRNGRGGALDFKLALKFYSLAAQQGLRRAQFNLGNLYMHGRGVDQDYKKAIEWFERAAETGHVPALINLGFMFESGYGVKKDPKVALKWYQRAANDGSALAKLLVKATRSSFPKENRVTARKDKKIAKAAPSNSHQTNLSSPVNNNFHWGPDVFSWPPKEGAPPQQMANKTFAKKRQAPPLDPFELGSKAFLIRNYSKALIHWNKAAELGDGRAQQALGEMYSKGAGTDKDYSKAINWYRRAASQGFTSSAVSLGLLYQNGRGVPRDFKKAATYFQVAASRGSARGQFHLGILHRNGAGLPQNNVAAFKLYQLAAEQGYAASQASLAWMYDNGVGVAKDEKAAIGWYRRAAVQGNADAQSNLGVKYFFGKGLAQNNLKAYVWFSVAAENGSAAAGKNLIVVKGRMTKPQIQLAAQGTLTCIEQKYKNC